MDFLPSLSQKQREKKSIWISFKCFRIPWISQGINFYTVVIAAFYCNFLKIVLNGDDSKIIVCFKICFKIRQDFFKSNYKLSYIHGSWKQWITETCFIKIPYHIFSTHSVAFPENMWLSGVSWSTLEELSWEKYNVTQYTTGCKRKLGNAPSCLTQRWRPP